MILKQQPQPDLHLIHFSGDQITFTLNTTSHQEGHAYLRTNLDRGKIRLEEIVRHAEENLPPLDRDWHDIPMQKNPNGTWELSLPLNHVGRYEAKTYFRTPDKTFHWPQGRNTIIKIEPAETISNNTIYTAFVRLFGSARNQDAVQPQHQAAVDQLAKANYSVLPPSGTFRDLIQQLDFIIGHLRCHIIQLLPIHPTPTTYARMGQYGSPFAALDLMDIDPALAEFDRATTPLDQFQELVDAIHQRNARIYLDMPINHTGWASHLQNHHPEWFARNPADDTFKSPGAWGILWEDLSKLDYTNRDLWRYMADVFLFWCRRGVDGFRCDAGYKVPIPTWRYIIAKVRLEYPETIFMLEGLGGDPSITEQLLDEAGMNWAYSEIFQNYDRNALENYLPASLEIARTKGNLIHFAETHDNARLAATSPTFARLRTALCALTSLNGAFGFSNGLEWLATQQINVHNAHSLNWGDPHNQVDWIRRIHTLLEIHPAFHPHAQLHLVTTGTGNVIALLRQDAQQKNRLLILANLDLENPALLSHRYKKLNINLLAETDPSTPLQPGEIRCQTDDPKWRNQLDHYLQHPYTGSTHAQTQRLKAHLSKIAEALNLPPNLDLNTFTSNPRNYCETLIQPARFIQWNVPHDQNRTVMIPPGHALLVQAPYRFTCEIHQDQTTHAHEKSFKLNSGTHALILTPLQVLSTHRMLTLNLTHFEPDHIHRTSTPLIQLSQNKTLRIHTLFRTSPHQPDQRLAICTNARGALAQVRSAWASLQSKYDALLQANLHPHLPVDRHTLFTRCRVWIQREGFSTELTLACQTHFGTNPDPHTVYWHFNVPVGQGFTLPLTITLRMHEQINAIELRFERRTPTQHPEELAADQPITLILRPDIEDRPNHAVTQAFTGPETHFSNAIQTHKDGFTFTPAPERQLLIQCPQSTFTIEPEWYYQIKHPIDQTRGTDGSSDLYSPGYFSISIIDNTPVTLLASVNATPTFGTLTLNEPQPQPLENVLQTAIEAFIVQREQLQTVIAGYPWFLDWGRDTLICLRGIIAAGRNTQAKAILIAFAKLERNGTLPNMISGEDHANRETSDAPLWLFTACNSLLQAQPTSDLLETDCGNRTLLDVLISIAECYINGTENGIHMDATSALIFSPSHFTWMDTNYPAGTPREGYPIEIQALWHAALHFLAQHTPNPQWKILAQNVSQSIQALYPIQRGDDRYLADVLSAPSGTPAHKATPDDALRPNQLFAITLGALKDPPLQRDLLQATEKLLIPGAIRSLADQPVEQPMPIYQNHQLINDPHHPYKGIYIGEEDNQRKPAYHNGTAWTWPFPSYAEALLQTYGSDVIPHARALLSSASLLLENGCIGHLPEILDGNTPHTQRGCAAQAWSVTELYRVWKQLTQ
ncbi:MAG: amylo-alpha-1,6-glucosidase [Pontiellaceae bacterium]